MLSQGGATGVPTFATTIARETALPPNEKKIESKRRVRKRKGIEKKSAPLINVPDSSPESNVRKGIMRIPKKAKEEEKERKQTRKQSSESVTTPYLRLLRRTQLARAKKITNETKWRTRVVVELRMCRLSVCPSVLRPCGLLGALCGTPWNDVCVGSVTRRKRAPTDGGAPGEI